jgi:oxygen-independent coproporphyrinogen-3 oxidase
MYSFKFCTNFGDSGELEEVLRAFYPHINMDESGENLELFVNENADIFYVEIFCNGKSVSKNGLNLQKKWDNLERKRQLKRFCKIMLYAYIKSITKISLPYGSLTGIRPTKLYRTLQENGENAEHVFRDYFDVSGEKTELVKSIVEVQKTCLNRDEKSVDFFVNIPFCPTRCTYCSFIAVPIEKLKKSLPQYEICLKKEINLLKKAIKNNHFKVRSVYVGGGTPTSLSPKMLKNILQELDFDAGEFTVEAGRPDTITSEVLDTLAECKVSRISINPQTFNDKTLRLIGRHHTVEDFYKAYELSEGYDFDVNIDLISALPEENFEDFKLSVDSAVALKPQNITVHTLAMKRGSALTVSGYENTAANLAEKMIDYSNNVIINEGYLPYYMYRQKYVCGNLENTGYALKGKECLYNIDIMEEDTNILAAGSGAISKKLDFSKNLLTRQPNFKDVAEYIRRFDEIEEKNCIVLANICIYNSLQILVNVIIYQTVPLARFN